MFRLLLFLKFPTMATESIQSFMKRQDSFKQKKRLLRQIGQIVDSACYYNDDDEKALTEAINKINKLTSNETTKN